MLYIKKYIKIYVHTFHLATACFFEFLNILFGRKLRLAVELCYVLLKIIQANLGTPKNANFFSVGCIVYQKHCFETLGVVCWSERAGAVLSPCVVAVGGLLLQHHWEAAGGALVFLTHWRVVSCPVRLYIKKMMSLCTDKLFLYSDVELRDSHYNDNLLHYLYYLACTSSSLWVEVCYWEPLLQEWINYLVLPLSFGFGSTRAG